MITPNKFRPLHKTVLGKLRYILEHKNSDIKLEDLYHLVEKKYDGIDEFIYALDILFVLGHIDIDFDRGVIKYVN